MGLREDVLSLITKKGGDIRIVELYDLSGAFKVLDELTQLEKDGLVEITREQGRVKLVK